MSQGLNIGLVLPALPGYSETFIHSKVSGLLNNGFKVTLFVNEKGDAIDTPLSIPVYYQVNTKNKLFLVFILFLLLILCPLTCLRLLKLEISSFFTIHKISLIPIYINEDKG